MRAILRRIIIPPALFFICIGSSGDVKTYAPPKEVRVLISLDKEAQNLGITSPQISGKASIYLLQKGIKPVFINEKESKRDDHLRIDVSARQKLVWVTASYIKVFKFKFRGDYSFQEGVVWSAEKAGLSYADSKSYLEYVANLIDSFLSEHYYTLRS